MPHSKIAQMSGNRFVENVRDSPLDHNTHATAHGSEATGMNEGERKIRQIRGF